MVKKYSCLITAYNENPQILNVLKIVTRVKNVSEIICVDDGSLDNTPDVVKANFPGVKLIVHETNKGKVDAIKTGIKVCRNANLLLLDADLVGLKKEEIEEALEIFEKNSLDCLVMLTRPDKYNRLVREIFKITTYVAGDRVLKKEILEKVLQDQSLKNYGLEIAENKYLLDSGKQVSRFQLSAVDLGKISKHGLIKGVIGEIRMWKDIFFTAGIKFLLQQKNLFAEERNH